jgi:hypothetical protein
MDELLLHRETGELSYAPDEFVPHTITATLSSGQNGAEICDLVFEYSIEESRGSSSSPDMGVKIVLGRYTYKVLSVAIEFTSHQDLLNRLALVDSWLGTRRLMLPKDSYKKNYQLVSEVIGDFIDKLVEHPELLD